MGIRQLPSVDRLVRSLDDTGLPRALVVEAARAAIEAARRGLAEGGLADPEGAAHRALETLRRARPAEVINATGVLLHTNLGRAPLSENAAEAARRAATGYSNLEIDLATGERAQRGSYLTELLSVVAGAEAGLAVNNNAGALYLTLAALASGRAVPVSRGELIEIGGSYRLPDLMAASGARLVEVGTTNRTRLDDYRRAFDQTSSSALLLKVHPSNYRLTGFTEQATLTQLATLAADRRLPLVFDVGSGLLDDRTPWLPGPPPTWLAGEPGVRQSLVEGADLVMFSGDKLLGGPQAGLMVGRADLVRKLSSHPVARALRLDGPTLAALTTTLEAYAEGTAGSLPFWQMATADYPSLEHRAAEVIAAAGVGASIEEGASTPGAGSVPGSEVPSPVIVVAGGDRPYLRLLGFDPPVVARRSEGRLVVDLRAVPPQSDAVVTRALAAACRS